VSSILDVIKLVDRIEANFINITIDKYNQKMVIGVEPVTGPQLTLSIPFVLSEPDADNIIIENLNHLIKMGSGAEGCII